jgi:hypothetical protein
VNLIYREQIHGPRKVYENLIKGLDLEGIAHIDNDPEASNHVHVLSDVDLAIEVLSRGVTDIVMGPNIVVHPTDAPILYERQEQLRMFVVNSWWTYDIYRPYFDRLAIWPVGIDTDAWPDLSEQKKSVDFLVYRKDQNHDLARTLGMLEQRGFTYAVLEYGHYTEGELYAACETSRFALFLAECESQGIAYQEVLSTNTPMVVFGRDSHTYKGIDYPASPAPYWDSRCGLVVHNDVQAIGDAIDRLVESAWNPRAFVLENLGLRQRAREYASL